MNKYRCYSIHHPGAVMAIAAVSSFEARKDFAAVCRAELTDVVAIRVRCEPDQHDFQPDPTCNLADVCSKCGEERA